MESLFDCAGRLLVRTSTFDGWSGRASEEARARPSLICGIVRAPCGLTSERCYAALLDASGLHLATGAHRDPQAGIDVDRRMDLGELTVTALLTRLRFRSGSMPGALELFMRDSVLPAEGDHRWMLVAGALLQRPTALSEDGIYEIGDGTARRLLLDGDERLRGHQPDGLLRVPLWGPQGRFGVVTTMAPARYEPWLAAERLRQSGRDMVFDRFLGELNRRARLPLFYDAQQLAQYEAQASAVMSDLLSEPAAATEQRQR